MEQINISESVEKIRNFDFRKSGLTEITIPSTAEQVKICDFNQNQSIDASDSPQHMKYIAGLVDNLLE